MTTGMPPSAVTSSDWPTEEVRIRRPARSDEAGEGLPAEHHLGRVGIDRQQLEAVALLQQGLEPRAPERNGPAQRGMSGLSSGRSIGVQLRLVRRGQAQQHVAEGHHAEPHQLQHLLAADAAAVEGHDLCMHAATGDFRNALGPERRLMRVILLDAGEAADNLKLHERVRVARMAAPGSEHQAGTSCECNCPHTMNRNDF